MAFLPLVILAAAHYNPVTLVIDYLIVWIFVCSICSIAMALEFTNSILSQLFSDIIPWHVRALCGAGTLIVYAVQVGNFGASLVKDMTVLTLMFAAGALIVLVQIDFIIKATTDRSQ
jgi:hypothetical protein